MKKTEKEFEQIAAFISKRRNEAIGFLNYTAVSTYWTVGAYVSRRIKSRAWGSATVQEFEDYVKTRHPSLKGYGRRQIYNMVEFFDAYCSAEFNEIFTRLRLDEFVPKPVIEIVQPSAAQMGGSDRIPSKVRRNDALQIVQPTAAQLDDGLLDLPKMPEFLGLITFTNHTEILNRCRRIEERVFYILYSRRERLNKMELRRAIVNQSYESVLSKRKRVTKALKEKYPDAEFMMKDRVFLEFLALPEKHTEPKLRRAILDHMKEFILELGKDYLYMGNEYHVKVGADDKRLDLLFYHRGLNCLVDVELKAVDFKPEFISKMNVYLEALDHDVRRPHENPSVGLLLCPSAAGTEVKYALDCNMSPIMVAEYKRQLIPEDVIKRSLEEYCRFMKREV